MEIEQRIADLITGLSENSVEPIGHVSDMSGNMINALSAHLQNLYHADPQGFEEKLELLESQRTAIGGHSSPFSTDPENTSVSLRGSDYMISVGEDLLTDPDYNFLDKTITAIADFELANATYHSIPDTRNGLAWEQSEKSYVESATWLQDAQRVGYTDIEIPPFADFQENGSSMFQFHRLNADGNLVQRPSDDSDISVTVVENMNFEAPSGVEAASPQLITPGIGSP
jgi:hypothetical protein